MPTVSVIIRTKNEQKWISKCLKAVFEQKFKDFEVVVVDNKSTDKTLKIVRKFPVKIALYNKRFRPGKAINLGIGNASGKYIAVLSGHCIPVNNNWLGDLMAEIKKPKVAGVYGRQLPLPSSSPLDKQDLLMFFGKDQLIQTKGHFFYFDNANSIIRRSVWQKIPFDEKVKHKENIIWGQEVVKKGYKIIYTPKAGVYHWHGINHAGNLRRAKEVVRILEILNPKS